MVTNNNKSKGSQNIDFSLTELVDIDRLQRIQDSFAIANGVASTIVDIHGVPITKPSNHSEVCKIIRSSPKGMENCRISGEFLGLEAKREMQAIHRMCLSGGFTDAAAPIVVDGTHIANWLIGQFHTRDVDEKHLREYAREIDVNEEQLVAEFNRMPKISLEHFNKVLDFLWLLANEISDMGYRTLIQKQQTEELQRIRSQLERHQTELEHKVAKRTVALTQLNSKLSKEIALKTSFERHLKEQQKLFETMFHSIPDGIVITNTEREIVMANKGMESTFGYKPQEIMGHSTGMLYADHQKFKEIEDTVFKKNTPKRSAFFYTHYHDKSGRDFPGEAFGAKLYDSDNQWIGNLGIIRDVSERVEKERENRKLQQQLLQAQKSEAIGTLAAGIAHEINTPAQYIRGNSEFIQESLDDICDMVKIQQQLVDAIEEDSQYQEHVAAIREMADRIDFEFLEEELRHAIKEALEGIERISSIVLAVKDFSLPGDEKKKKEDLNKLIQLTATVSRHEWQEHAEMELDLSEKLPKVPLLSSAFKQIMLSLIINAAEAIAAERDGEDSPKGIISIKTRHDKDFAVILVRDNGPGIPENNIDRIFDPFFTTKKVGKGMGQGLALVYKNVTDGHNGTISVQSSPGKGTEFCIQLPLS